MPLNGAVKLLGLCMWVGGQVTPHLPVGALISAMWRVA